MNPSFCIRYVGKLSLTVAHIFASILFVGTRLGAEETPPEVVIRLPSGISLLPTKEQKQVNEAIERGAAYLRRTQSKDGFWRPMPGPGNVMPPGNATGYTALTGLALLETGIPPEDAVVQKGASFVRQKAPNLKATYDISLAILFLDRLRDPEDRKLISTLALRIAAGQTEAGGWNYVCHILQPADEQKVLEDLRQQKMEKQPKPLTALRTAGTEQRKLLSTSYGGDNSNTQFAMLALWVACRRHELPFEPTLCRVEERFRFGQMPAGWGYFVAGPPYGAMTAVGLMGLAVGRGAAPEAQVPGRPQGNDEGINTGLWALGSYLTHPGDRKKGAVNLYFLWSLERVGVLYNLKTIGGKDWYAWGVKHVLPAQKANGSWFGDGYLGSSPTVDTCFALLFLKRSDLFPELREKLHEYLSITDPGPNLKGIGAKSPGDKGDTPTKKDVPTPEESLKIDLGDIKGKLPAQKPARVRGPLPFRIIDVRGANGQLRVNVASETRELHELALTLNPDKQGNFRRTIYLITDLPGRMEVPVQIQARVVGR